MKKIYTSLTMLAIGAVAFGQATSNLPFRSVDKSTSEINGRVYAQKPSTAMAPKAVLFTENFESVTAPALPAGMSSSSNSGATTAGWYTGDAAVANAGGYWPVPAHTQFAMTNDDTNNDILCDELLILPELNFSGQSNMIISFDAFHDQGYGSGDAIVKVSTDQGATWTDVFTLLVDAANWQTVVVNLSAYDGNTSVTLGIWWNDGGDCTAAGDNWGTGLAIDNIVVENAPSDEIAANWILPGDIVNDYEYTMMPIGQARPLGMTMSIANNGSNNQSDVAFDYDITFGGNSVSTGSSAQSTVNSFSLDTISVSSTYTPAAVGTYTMTGTATMAATDANTSNNSATTSLEVTNSVWARDYTTFDGAFYNISGHNGAGVKIGHLFLVSTDQTFKAIQIGIANSTAHEGQLVFGEVYYWDGSAWTYLEGTDDHTINNAVDGGSIIELCLTNPLDVTAGQEILVVAGHYGGATDATDHVRFATAGVARQGTVLGFDGSGSAFQLISPPAPVVRFSTTCVSGVEETVSGVTVGQNYPNPFNGNTTVNYSLTNSDNVMIEITDLTGKVIAVMNEGVRAAGTHTVEINSANLAAGTYYYSVVTSNGRITRAMAVAK